MTNEQAIAMISHIKEYIVDNQGDKEYGGALDMAIEALETIANGYVPDGFMPIGYHDKVYAELQKRYFDLLERTRWIPVSERLPTEQDANSKGKIAAWCTSFNGTEIDLNWRFVEKGGVITHWRIGIEPPEQDV